MTAVVVTGGGGGIGQAIVRRLLGEGHTAVVLDRAEPPVPLEEVWVVTGSASDDHALERAVELARAGGGLAGWVNCAADFTTRSLHDTSSGEWVDLVAHNLAMAAAGCRAAIREFLRTGAGGAIVNVSSHQPARPVRGGATYATAKAAIDGLTRALAVD